MTTSTEILQTYKTLTDIEKSYIAGLFDGEGCIGVYKRNDSSALKLKVNLIGTKKEFMYYIYNLLSTVYSTSIYEYKNREVYSININIYSYLKFIEDIKPYLILKYNNLLLLEKAIYNKINKKYDDTEICNESTLLNCRGPKNKKVDLYLDSVKSITDRYLENYNKSLNLSYLAALLDGEGTVYISKHYNYDLVFLESTNLEYIKVLQKLINNIFKCNLNIHQRKKNHISRHDSWAIEIGDRTKILQIIELLKPYTILKKQRLEVMKSHILSQDNDKKCELFLQLKDLNRRNSKQ